MAPWTCNECQEVVTTDFCTFCGRSRPELQRCVSCGATRETGGRRTGKFCGRCGHEWGVPAPIVAPVEGIPIARDRGDREAPPPPNLVDGGRSRDLSSLPARRPRPPRRAPVQLGGESDDTSDRCETILTWFHQIVLWVMIPVVACAITIWGDENDKFSAVLATSLLTLTAYIMYLFLRLKYSSQPMKELLTHRGSGELLFYVIMVLLTLQPLAHLVLKRVRKPQAPRDPIDPEYRCSNIIWVIHQVAVWLFMISVIVVFTVQTESETASTILRIFMSVFAFSTYAVYLFWRLILPFSDTVKELLGSGYGRLLFYIFMAVLTLEPLGRFTLALIDVLKEQESEPHQGDALSQNLLRAQSEALL